MKLAQILMVSSTVLAGVATTPAGSLAQDVAQLTGTNDLAVAEDLAIRQVIARANQALDLADYDLYASFFAEDAVFTSGFGDSTGRAEIAAAMEASRSFITDKRHVSANYVINGEGDEAVVTTYLIVFEREADLSFVGSAINVDTMRRTPDGWLIARHDSTLDPATQRAMSAALDSASGVE